MAIGNCKDFWSGILFALLGVFFIYFAQEHELGAASRMGPAYFPTVLGILLAAVGTVVALIGYFKKAAVLETGEDTGEIQPFHWNVLLLILGVLVAIQGTQKLFGKQPEEAAA